MIFAVYLLTKVITYQFRGREDAPRLRLNDYKLIQRKEDISRGAE